MGHLGSLLLNRLQSIHCRVPYSSSDSLRIAVLVLETRALMVKILWPCLNLVAAQAAAIMAAVNAGVNIEEYYPKMVKKSITGNGNASKEQVAYMLDRILGPERAKIPRPMQPDALAVAWWPP